MLINKLQSILQMWMTWKLLLDIHFSNTPKYTNLSHLRDNQGIGPEGAGDLASQDILEE